MSRLSTTTSTNDATLAHVENELSLGSLTPEELRDNRPTLSEAIEIRRREDLRLKSMGQSVK